MKRFTFNVLFYIRRTRLNKNGMAPVMMRITKNGGSVESSISRSILPSHWDSHRNRALSKGKECRELNAYLDEIVFRLNILQREMEAEGIEVTPKSLLNKYQGKSDKPQHTILEIFKEHNEKCQKLIGKSMAADTVQRYKTSYKHTEEFIAHQYHVSDLNIEQLDHKFITDYEFYLKTVRNCSNNTTIKYLKNFKKIIRIALANNYLSVDPFAQVQFKLDEVVQEFLEEHELNRIINKEFSVPRLEQVRDVFVFCCYTGLAFSDVKQLRAEHIFVDNSGAHWIRKQRQKTNVMCTIPILDVAQEILDKYKDSPACKDGQLLPVLSNQKHNAYIKEIMDVCGITKKISSHTARHTAATVTFLGNGVSIENVAKMLGHTNTKMTHRYAKVLDSNVFSQMQDVNSKINTKKVC